MSRPYSEALMMKPEVSYIPYATSYNEQTGDIINFAQFEEGGLVENERNVVYDKSILASIYKSYTEDDSYYGFMSRNALKDIRDGKYVHRNINVRYPVLKISDHISQLQIERKGAEI